MSSSNKTKTVWLEKPKDAVNLDVPTVTRMISLKEDGTLLCTHKFANQITRWCPRTGRKIRDYNVHVPHHAKEVIQLEDGGIASGGGDGTIAIWMLLPEDSSSSRALIFAMFDT